MTTIESGTDMARSATSIMQLSGNLGGVVMIIALGALKGDSDVLPSAFAILMSLLIAANFCAIVLKPIQAKNRVDQVDSTNSQPEGEY